MASPFLQYIAEFMYARRYAKRTVEGYLYWIKMYILCHKKQHPTQLKDGTATAVVTKAPKRLFSETVTRHSHITFH